MDTYKTTQMVISEQDNWLQLTFNDPVLLESLQNVINDGSRRVVRHSFPGKFICGYENGNFFIRVNKQAFHDKSTSD